MHVADLACLKIDDSAVAKFSNQIGDILAYVDTLNQVDTADVTPTTHAISLTNAFREDGDHKHLPRDLVLANAPAEEDGAFLVPKVIE